MTKGSQTELSFDLTHAIFLGYLYRLDCSNTYVISVLCVFSIHCKDIKVNTTACKATIEYSGKLKFEVLCKQMLLVSLHHRHEYKNCNVTNILHMHDKVMDTTRMLRCGWLASLALAPTGIQLRE